MVITKKNIRTGTPSAAVLGNPVVLNSAVEAMPIGNEPPPVPKTQAEWDECRRGDWLIYWAEKSGVDPRLLVRARCKMVRLLISVFKEKEEDTRSLDAVRAAEAWSRDMATVEEVRRAVTLANVAFLAQASEDSQVGGFSAGYYAAYAAATAADSVYLVEEPSFSVASAVAAAEVARTMPKGTDTFERILRTSIPRNKIHVLCANVVRGEIAWNDLKIAKD